MRRRGVTGLLGPALFAVGLSGCSEVPGPLVRDHYATLEDCAADWGRPGNCDRVQSSGYSGGMVVFRGPAYPQNARESARRDAMAAGDRPGSAGSPDSPRQGRAIGTVREPAARDGAPGRSRLAPPIPPRETMPSTVAESVADLPYFVAFLGIALVLFTLGLAGYVALAARRDMRLIAEGNVAVASGMTGAFIGFALPLASAVIRSEVLLDMLVWGGIALAAQLLVLAGLRLMLSSLVGRMRDGQVASGVFLGAAAVSVGILNAACLMY
jgi:putative membrane protein